MKVAIIGGGAGGIAMAIALKRTGHEPVLFERSRELGGTWHDNVYPGAGCDVPSHLYCFSFAPGDWPRRFSLQRDIQHYFARVADEHALAPHLQLGTEVTSARFVDDGWRVTTSAGEHTVDAVVTATGQLNRPHIPALPGIEAFTGARFHSARWDHSCDLTGDVVVVGCGASAIQFVPQIAPHARSVTILQRSPPYVVARKDRAYRRWERWILRNVPLVRRWYRALIYWGLESRFPALRTNSWMSRLTRWMALRHLRAGIADPALRAALTPDYPIGCKRILISDDWYPTLARPNVRVVTSPIAGITADAVVTADGAPHRADALIYATGFESQSFVAPIEIVGPHGTLADAWRGGAEAHRGITVAGFPNLFLLYGPNTNLGHNSILFMLECQVRYVAKCLDELVRRGARWLDVRREVMARYNAALQQRIAGTAWTAGCGSWYTAADGKVTNNWSSRTINYWWQNRRPDFSEFDVR
jgi:cation diffusion facilitator CzcD-associated flavoprotein CzcO